jgi:hypothetical protein
MTPKKLAKLRRELEGLRQRGGIKSRELEGLAKRMGRVRRPQQTGDPQWVNEELNWRPLSIPSHPGDMPRGTAGSVMNQLDEDLFRLEELYGND